MTAVSFPAGKAQPPSEDSHRIQGCYNVSKTMADTESKITRHAEKREKVACNPRTPGPGSWPAENPDVASGRQGATVARTQGEKHPVCAGSGVVRRTEGCAGPSATAVLRGGAGRAIGWAPAVEGSPTAAGTRAPSPWWESKRSPRLTLGGASCTLLGPLCGRELGRQLIATGSRPPGAPWVRKRRWTVQVGCVWGPPPQSLVRSEDRLVHLWVIEPPPGVPALGDPP